MAQSFEFTFADHATLDGGTVVCLMAKGGPAAGAAEADPAGVLARAAEAMSFKARALSVLDVVAPQGSPADRLLVVGLGDAKTMTAHDWLKAGGATAAKLKRAQRVTVFLDVASVPISAQAAADFALGMEMNAYRFDRYKTKKKDEDDAAEPKAPARVTIVTAAAAEATRAAETGRAVSDGVFLARDLVNLPPNVLGPVEFAARAQELVELGVEVEILTEAEMAPLGMGALLGVAQGSSRPPRLVILSWKGGAEGEAPVAFIGKGVVFDSGGISIKPGAGMEDMKGDMGGAAAVTGLMHVLAARKAKVNAIGILGLVENMPDGNAQRPGDIVTSMSGQTIEIINTDAEGRLVLCDALWYCNDRFKPKLMINLATLTGAVMVALGHHHAGLFSNDDTLADQLLAAGRLTQERLWRLPLGPDYDKMIDSKFADMKNTGGRYGGSITAAQFLKRFVKDTPWAHLDIAGTAMGSPTDEVNQSWGSGFGVRLLDAFVRESCETDAKPEA
ncbi:leucyl aminopeptidase [Xaviernesmea oryzae]|uniref:Probable cytosol aminopeptidase n=1 Tax=Xaviernesmea oryzae TaxID=464029 RepID=A0A1Q9ASX3_9HYPH|nr:leucyl aminopeptidase [Xaviernesmea oryzae]OLP58534.1 leucyl aminopeptidase [Xaviernesmea oryzae]SEK61003.1 leucyl aminopeptidase [Xaviernesmea oryzae]